MHFLKNTIFFQNATDHRYLTIDSKHLKSAHMRKTNVHAKKLLDGVKQFNSDPKRGLFTFYIVQWARSPGQKNQFHKKNFFEYFPYLLQKMEQIHKKIREIDSFHLTSFFGLYFFKFSGPL